MRLHESHAVHHGCIGCGVFSTAPSPKGFSHMRSSFALLGVILTSALVLACGSSQAPASDGPLVSPSPTASPASPVGSPSSSSKPSLPPPSSGPVSPSPTSSETFVGQVVTTLADDGLRVRSQPRVSDDSYLEQPLLPLGTHLYVLAGPVSASGYAWYEVAPLSSRTLPSGWVASADRGGEPWFEVGSFRCPSVPTDFRSLAALPRGVGLACFSRVPITVEARLISCNCDADGAGYEPSWFFLGSGSPDLLVSPDVTSVPPSTEDWFALNLDPAGEQPDVLPDGEIVEVTGIFDHPAAASCTRTEMDGEPASSPGCRLEFAVTRLLLQGP